MRDYFQHPAIRLAFRPRLSSIATYRRTYRVGYNALHIGKGAATTLLAPLQSKKGSRCCHRRRPKPPPRRQRGRSPADLSPQKYPRDWAISEAPKPRGIGRMRSGKNPGIGREFCRVFGSLADPDFVFRPAIVLDVPA
jgi:hypothetical protein